LKRPSLVLIAAFVASLALHLGALFGFDADFSSAREEPPPLQAEIRFPQLPKPKVDPASKPKSAARTAPERGRMLPVPSTPPSGIVVADQSASETTTAAAPPVKPLEPDLPARGKITYLVYRGTQGFQIGRAEHEWEFIDGSYRIRIVTETSGLAALFKPVRVEMESRGKFAAHGLQPDNLTTWRNGTETGENAEFNWDARQISFSRNARRQELPDGAQDIVSFHYQLALIPELANGFSLNVATGKKFERYRFETLGEEQIETPAGNFRTLRVRVQSSATTEIWLALDRQMLPVKIRHFDRKGESYEQIADSLGDLP